MKRLCRAEAFYPVVCEMLRLINMEYWKNDNPQYSITPSPQQDIFLEQIRHRGGEQQGINPVQDAAMTGKQ